MYFSLYAQPRCIFIRIRKTGSTSIVNGLLGENETRQVVEDIPDGWQDAFCFTFVRNPFERMVSAVEMFRSAKTGSEAERRFQANLSLDSAMDVLEDDAIIPGNSGYMPRLKLHLLPASHPNYRIDQAGFVGRFETFGTDYARLAEQLGIAVAEVPHFRRRDGVLDYRPLFTPQARSRAEAILAEDCRRFDYAF